MKGSAMRRAFICGVLLASSFLARAAGAQTHDGFVQGFGGLRVSSAPTTTPSFGGTVGVGLTPNLQAVGEVGRVGDVLPATAESLLSLSPVDFRVSALYGEGGIRLTSDAHSPVRVYGETLAGFTRLNAELGGIGSPTADLLLNIGLRFVNTTSPIAALGGGVILQGGPVMATVGYRFSRIFASDAFAGLLTGGDLDVNEVRFGVGFRF
jgi:hypothetical protein